MFPDPIVRESAVADENLALRSERQISPYHHLRRYRFCALLVLALFGLHLLAAGSGAGKGDPLTAQQAAPGHAPIQTAQASEHRTPLAVGMGAGASSSERTGATAQAAVCLNPLDVTCWLQNAAQWVAQQIINALQPVINAILKSPLNIITQTPPADTYQNSTVSVWCSAFLTVVDLALASLIVIGGYNMIVGRELGLPPSGLAGVLAPLLLALCAAHLSPYLPGPVIGPEDG